jgi:hypothetical protein
MWIARLIRWWREALHNRSRDLRVMMGKYPKYNPGDDVPRRDDVLDGCGHPALGEYLYGNHRPGKGGVGGDPPPADRGVTGVLGYDLDANPDYQYCLREGEEFILEPALWWRYSRRRKILGQKERGDGQT